MSDYKTKLNILDKLLKNNESSLKHKIIQFLDWKHCEGCMEKFEADKMYQYKPLRINICQDCKTDANHCSYKDHYFIGCDPYETVCPDCQLDRDVDYDLKEFHLYYDTWLITDLSD